MGMEVTVLTRPGLVIYLQLKWNVIMQICGPHFIECGNCDCYSLFVKIATLPLSPLSMWKKKVYHNLGSLSPPFNRTAPLKKEVESLAPTTDDSSTKCSIAAHRRSTLPYSILKNTTRVTKHGANH